MARKKRRNKSSTPGLNVPVYPIGVAAKLLDVHPRTLRLYEAEGLIKPSYHGSRRLFSQSDIQWIMCLRSMIHDEGISIPGIKRLLDLQACYEILDCPREVHETCEARVERRVTPDLCSRCAARLPAAFEKEAGRVHEK